MDWTKQIAIITGAGRGIGAAAAQRLNALGARVMLVSRTASELRAVQASCKDPSHILWAAGDLADANFIHEVFATVRARWGNLTILVNNAATLSVVDLCQVSAEALRSTLDVNIAAPFTCTQLAFRAMKSSGHGGSVVNISSLGGLAGTEKFRGFSLYTMSKFALVGLTESAAVEGKALGIRVNCIAPGAVNTRMLEENVPHLKSNTSADDIAKIIVFLVDEEQSGALTGSVIPVMTNVSN